MYLRFVSANARNERATTGHWQVFTGASLPPAAGILIEGDRFSTRLRDVGVDVAGSIGGQPVTRVRLSNTAVTGADGLLSDGTEFDYAARLAWQLTAGADGWRSVYAQLSDADANWSSVLTDAIFLDTTPPSGSFVVDHDAAKVGDAWGNIGGLGDQTLSGSVSDNSLAEPEGKITHFAVSNDCTHYKVATFDMDPAAFETSWQIYAYAWGNITDWPGVKTICAKFRDAAGNWSAVATDYSSSSTTSPSATS